MAEKEPLLNIYDNKSKDIMRTTIFTKGINTQVKKCIEEMAELTTALLHNRDNKATYMDVCTEIADVLITAREMQLIYGEKEVDSEVNRKLLRLEERIKQEKGVQNGEA